MDFRLFTRAVTDIFNWKNLFKYAFTLQLQFFVYKAFSKLQNLVLVRYIFLYLFQSSPCRLFDKENPWIMDRYHTLLVVPTSRSDTFHHSYRIDKNVLSRMSGQSVHQNPLILLHCAYYRQ